jgi:hypothetical protein
VSRAIAGGLTLARVEFLKLIVRPEKSSCY